MFEFVPDHEAPNATIHVSHGLRSWRSRTPRDKSVKSARLGGLFGSPSVKASEPKGLEQSMESGILRIL